MESLSAFKGIESYFMEFHKKFKKVYDAADPQSEKMPGEWDDKLSSF